MRAAALKARLAKIEAREDTRPIIWHDVTPATDRDDPAEVQERWDWFIRTGDDGDAWYGSGELRIPVGMSIDDACEAAARIPGGNHRLTVSDPDFFPNNAHQLQDESHDESTRPTAET